VQELKQLMIDPSFLLKRKYDLLMIYSFYTIRMIRASYLALNQVYLAAKSNLSVYKMTRRYSLP